MFVVYSVAISTHNTVNLCLSKTYIWPTCNDSLSVYRAVPLEVIYWYIQPTQTVHRWNSTWREIPDQFVIVGTCAGLVCCPKTYIEWSTRFLVLSGKLTVSCHRGTALTVLHIYLQFVMQTLGQKHWSSRHFSLLSCDSHLLRDATIFHRLTDNQFAFLVSMWMRIMWEIPYTCYIRILVILFVLEHCDSCFFLCFVFTVIERRWSFWRFLFKKRGMSDLWTWTQIFRLSLVFRSRAVAMVMCQKLGHIFPCNVMSYVDCIMSLITVWYIIALDKVSYEAYWFCNTNNSTPIRQIILCGLPLVPIL